MLKEPFQLLARGVRAVETMTAELMKFSGIWDVDLYGPERFRWTG
jgi:hypothetical protein